VDVLPEPPEPLPVEEPLPQLSSELPEPVLLLDECPLEESPSELLVTVVVVSVSAVADWLTKNTPASDADAAAALTPMPTVARRMTPIERRRMASGSAGLFVAMPQL
jgi:hypothetical protein